VSEGIGERHLRVGRTARLFFLGEPGNGTRELWIACHGYGQLAASFAPALEPLRAPDRVVVAPEALSRFYLDDPAKRHGPDSPIGASWMTREDREREITDYVDYLDAVVDAVVAETPRNVRITGLGFSQGAATICRWAALGRSRLARVVVWGGTLPQDLPSGNGAALFRGADVVLVGGRKDKLATPESLERDKVWLTERSIPVRLLWHEGGHSLSSSLLREIAAQ
jgi:predicted esterase